MLHKNSEALHNLFPAVAPVPRHYQELIAWMQTMQPNNLPRYKDVTIDASVKTELNLLLSEIRRGNNSPGFLGPQYAHTIAPLNFMAKDGSPVKALIVGKQSRLVSFRETAVIENTLITNSCVNCHSFAAADQQRFQFHLRGPGRGTLVRSEGELTHIDTIIPGTVSACVYPHWHPSGSHIAYSVNNILQSFQNVPEKVIDVFDTWSDIVIYELKKQAVHIHPVLCDSTVLETFPAFSADGQTLYYTAAPFRNIAHVSVLDNIRYSLYSIPLNPGTNTVAPPAERLYPLSDPAGLSVSFPGPSPDGRSLMFTGSAYGNFTIWHDDADLWLMDLSTGKTEPTAALNSPDTESYHSWSSASKWVVFSSRRDDGRYTRLNLAHMNERGTFNKPFALPQKDPRSDLNLMQSYNLPEFVKGIISFYPQDIFRAKHIKAQEWKH